MAVARFAPGSRASIPPVDSLLILPCNFWVTTVRCKRVAVGGGAGDGVPPSLASMPTVLHPALISEFLSYLKFWPWPVELALKIRAPLMEDERGKTGSTMER